MVLWPALGSKRGHEKEEKKIRCIRYVVTRYLLISLFFRRRKKIKQSYNYNSIDNDCANGVYIMPFNIDSTFNLFYVRRFSRRLTFGIPYQIFLLVSLTFLDTFAASLASFESAPILCYLPNDCGAISKCTSHLDSASISRSIPNFVAMSIDKYHCIACPYDKHIHRVQIRSYRHVFPATP